MRGRAFDSGCPAWLDFGGSLNPSFDVSFAGLFFVFFISCEKVCLLRGVVNISIEHIGVEIYSSGQFLSCMSYCLFVFDYASTSAGAGGRRHLDEPAISVYETVYPRRVWMPMLCPAMSVQMSDYRED